jgi:hypothetical protein
VSIPLHSATGTVAGGARRPRSGHLGIAPAAGLIGLVTAGLITAGLAAVVVATPGSVDQPVGGWVFPGLVAVTAFALVGVLLRVARPPGRHARSLGTTLCNICPILRAARRRPGRPARRAIRHAAHSG